MSAEQSEGSVPSHPAGSLLHPEDLAEWALALTTLGGLLLAIDSVLVLFVWVGFRSGSYMWAYWTAAQFVVGVILFGAGWSTGARATANVSELRAPEPRSREAA